MTDEERTWLDQIIATETSSDEQPVLRWCLDHAVDVQIDTDDNGSLEWVVFHLGKDGLAEFCWNPDDGWDGDPPILAILDALVASEATTKRYEPIVRALAAHGPCLHSGDYSDPPCVVCAARAALGTP